jgi:hypothetical protein
MAKIAGANRDGDKRQSLKRPTKLDTGSPENLISLALCEDLDAELIEDTDNLTGIKTTELEVEGAAMVYLTWLGESGERKEIIYCLVVRDLPFDLIVSREKEEDLFEELQKLKDGWVASTVRSVLPIFDKMTRQQREETDRRRQTALERAQAIQAKKDKDLADLHSPLNRFALDVR